MSLIDDLRKFSSRSWQERGLFFEAMILLGVMRAAILLLPFRTITGKLGLVQGEPSAASGSVPASRAEATAWAIKAAAARTPWESACLAQALTGVVMLGRRGIDATLFLGVAKDSSGPDAMNAHAWLRCGDVILTGASGVERYAAISSFSRPRTEDAHRRQGSHRTDP